MPGNVRTPSFFLLSAVYTYFIFEEGELDKNSVCANFAHTAEDGKTYQTQFFHF
jgi:hypothetical protein